MAGATTPSSDNGTDAGRIPVDGIPRLVERGVDVDGRRVRTNTQCEKIRGEYVTNPTALEVGDDILVVYRERRDGGGLRYRTYAQQFTARIDGVDDEVVHLTRDFTAMSATIRMDAHHDGRPTLRLGEESYLLTARESRRLRRA